jgi:hypothetical protein
MNANGKMTPDVELYIQETIKQDPTTLFVSHVLLFILQPQVLVLLRIPRLVLHVLLCSIWEDMIRLFTAHDLGVRLVNRTRIDSNSDGTLAMTLTMKMNIPGKDQADVETLMAERSDRDDYLYAFSLSESVFIFIFLLRFFRRHVTSSITWTGGSSGSCGRGW